MSGIIPIPTTRVGDLFVRQRLTSQTQQDQLALFRLQNQIATGRRLQLPSEDAPAALRAINVQRLIDRKGQIKTNIETSNQFLSNADTRLRGVADDLIKLRGEVVGVSGSTTPQASRQNLARSIDGLLQELVNAGNGSLYGRYLFAGSSSQSQPYAFKGSYVEYSGNDGSLHSFVDVEQLFKTNLAGTDVFGGVSAAVEGSADLNPQVSVDMLVSTLNGGSGIGPNASISLSVTGAVSTESSVIDLSSAVTVGDLARLIEDGAPAGADVTVDVTGTGLVLRTGSGTISVAEASEGRTARLLGVLTDPDVPATSAITGLDLNPALLKTTRLSDVLGTKAQGVVEFAGANNDLRLTATANGATYNNLTVVLQGGGAAGSEVAAYDSGTNTLTITVQDGVSTAEQVAAAITAEGHFTAEAHYRDADNALQIGKGKMQLLGAPSVSMTNATSGGGGEVLDTASGLHLTNAGEEVVLDLGAAETVEDVLNLIHGAGIGLLAEVNANGSGINVRSRVSGADFMIGENGGTTATQLGIRTYTGATELAGLNRGLGVPTTTAVETLNSSQLDQLRIVARDGTVIDVNLAGATTLQDVAALINGDAENNVGTTSVLARLTGGGNRLELVDSSTGATGPLRVEAPSGTTAAEYLGFVPTGATQQASTASDSSGNDVLGGQELLKNDLAIVARNGTQLSVDLAGATTVQDVIDRINNNADNVPPIITARLAQTGNGIELVDTSVGGGTLSVHTAEGSLAAHYLGFVAAGQTQSDPADVTLEGGAQVLKSEDRNTIESDSMFNTLIRLRTALESNDDVEIGRSLDRLDADIGRLNFARAEIGSRLQNLDTIGIRLEDENVELQSALSKDIDVDLIEAISELTARQYAFEASLRSSASLMQMTLLNFL